MIVLRSVLLAACVTASLPAGAAVIPASTATSTGSFLLAKTDGDAKISDADKRAKAADCSKQADEKKLHGAERKKFREECKRK